MKKILSFTLCVMICTSLSAQDKDIFERIRAHKGTEKIKALLQSRAVIPGHLAKKADGNLSRAVDFFWDNTNNEWSADTNAVFTYAWKGDNTIDSVVENYETERVIYKDFVLLDLELESFVHLGKGEFPSYSEYQNWDTSSKGWVPSYREVFMSSNGRMEESVYEDFDGSTWNPSEKIDFTYDSLGSFTGYGAYEWQVNKWVFTDGFKLTYSYNSSGHITEAVYEEYFNGSWEMEDAEKYLLNSDGSIHTVFKGEIYNDTFYVFDSMLITWQNFEARPSMNMFLELYEYVAMVGGTAYDTFASYTDDWPDGWVDYERGSVTYNSSGLRTMEVRDNYYNSTWNNDLKLIWDYYPTGDLSKHTELRWNGTGWDTIQSRSIDIVKDSEGDILSKADLTKRYNNGSLYAADGTKTIFEYELQSGITKAAGLSGLSIYPNPATSVIYFNTPPGNDEVQIEIKDLTGRTVLMTNTPARDRIAVDVSTLASGNYIITVNTGKEVLYSKLLKQ